MKLLKVLVAASVILFSASCSTEGMLSFMGYTWHCSAEGENGVTYRATGDTKKQALSRLYSKCSNTNCWSSSCQPR